MPSLSQSVRVEIVRTCTELAGLTHRTMQLLKVSIHPAEAVSVALFARDTNWTKLRKQTKHRSKLVCCRKWPESDR